MNDLLAPPAIPKLPDLSGIDSMLTKFHNAAGQINTAIWADGFWRGVITASVALLVAAFFFGPWHRGKS
jgi:hypothetical protein